jgi:curved DNA-binding protein CbpA
MGNHQSNSHQLTPEQYQQYQYFLQQQQQQQQPMANRPLQQQQPMANRPPQQQPPMANRQQMPNRQPTNVNQTQQNNRGVQNTFNNIQQQRTQVRVQNQNIDVKMIPNLQQKSKMPSVENSLQTAYDQRMSDNFNSMGYSQKTSVNGFKEIPNYKRQDTINPRQEQYLEKEHLQEQEFIRNQQEQQEMAYRKYKAEQDAKRRGFFNNLNNEIDEIEQLKYNPEQILGLTEGIVYSELEIKKAYRNLALKYHPDKGGTEEVFKILTKAYMYLLKKAQGSNYVEKNFMDLKGNYERDGGGGVGGGTNSDDFNVKNFNKLFEDNKLENEEWDNGYGDWKTDDVSDTPKKIFNQKFTADVFNQVFNELKNNNNTTNQEVIVFEDPKPLTVSNRFGFSDVDYKRTGDYSKEYDIQDGNSRQGIYYMDYKRAYTETTLISPNVVKSRKEFKDIEDAQVAREKQDFTMTEEERAFYEEKKRKEEEFELQRLERLRNRDDQIEQHSNQVNRLLLGNKPQATRSLEYQRK